MNNTPEAARTSRDPILFQGLRLPPKELRLGSMAQRDDAHYVGYARGSAKLLAEQCGLSPQSKLLDIGCGPGRLLIGALSLYGAIEEYVGLDVNKPAIEWASRHLADAQHITFHWMNILNQRYNPKGTTINAEIMFPVPADRFDVVALLSVFSHMYLQDIGAYLKEIRRILTPSGKVFLTLFVEEGVPAEEENPPGYLNKWSGPLHCVRIRRHSFEDAVHESGLLVQAYRYRHMSSGQSSYVLSRS